MRATERPSPARQTKRECHKCPRNGKGDDYCWRVCLGPADDSRKGVSMVNLGGMPAADEYIERNALDDTPPRSAFCEPARLPPESAADEPSPVAAGLSYEVERRLVKVLATFMSLSDTQLCIFRHAYNGENLSQIGRRLQRPISKQAVSKHIRDMRRADPVLGRLIPQLVRLPPESAARGFESEGDATEVRAEQGDLFAFAGMEVDALGGFTNTAEGGGTDATHPAANPIGDMTNGTSPSGAHAREA